MNLPLRLLLALFTMLCTVTTVDAIAREVRVVAGTEETHILEGGLALPADFNAAKNVDNLKFWKKADFNGTRVYQRKDLIDPKLVDSRGRTNLERMQKGLAPVGPDGQSINLHHTIQSADSPLAEVTRTFHQQNSSIIHINPNTIPSGIDRNAFNAFRRDYWIN